MMPADQQLRCSQCAFFTHSFVTLKNHERVHLPAEEITCAMCSYVTITHSVTWQKLQFVMSSMFRNPKDSFIHLYICIIDNEYVHV